MVSISQAAWDAIVVENVGLKARLARVERLAAMLRDPRQWVQNEWTTRISQELDASLRAASSASVQESGSHV